MKETGSRGIRKTETTFWKDQARHTIMAVLCLLAGTMSSIAQNVRVDQTLDSISILIGEQAHMTVAIEAPDQARILFPNWKPRTYLVPGVEIVSVDTDSLKNSDGEFIVSKTLTLTSFDENLYPIPAAEVKVNGVVHKGQQLALKVLTVDVDTLHPNQFFPPKSVQNPPFLWQEWKTIFGLSLLLAILLPIGFWLYLRLRANKPIIASIRIVKRLLPHQKAMKAIDQIKADHMQTSEDQKEYYTRLTETLRQYIRERFGFNAMEMTTAEILEHLHQTGDSTMMAELQTLFETADLVKFAKYSTLLGENDQNLVNAIQFIDQTKQEGQPTEERIVPQLTADDKKSQKNRIAIKTLLWLIALASGVILVQVVRQIAQLL